MKGQADRELPRAPAIPLQGPESASRVLDQPPASGFAERLEIGGRGRDHHVIGADLWVLEDTVYGVYRRRGYAGGFQSVEPLLHARPGEKPFQRGAQRVGIGAAGRVVGVARVLDQALRSHALRC